MKINVGYGLESVELEVTENRLLALRREAFGPPLADPAVAVRAALAAPLRFPPLRRALTPDDHVTVVIDDHLPRFLDLLCPVLDHLVEAGVAPSAMTLLSATASSRTAWVDDLPDAFEDVTLEVHDPTNRRRLSYLATTRTGRRVYLNRSLVDADQTVVLTGRGYHPWLGYSGAEAALFPTLSDEATLQELAGETTEASRQALNTEAVEVAWLLGVPFLVQVIEGAGDTVADVLAGSIDASAEGRRRLDARWRVSVDKLADVVIATLSGDPSRHDFADLAQGLAQASRVVRSGGRIVLLTRARPTLQMADLLLQAGDTDHALALLQRHQPLNVAARQWAEAASHARISLLSDLPSDTVESLFATPLENAGQAQRLLDSGERCLLLEDAHKTFTDLS